MTVSTLISQIKLDFWEQGTVSKYPPDNSSKWMDKHDPDSVSFISSKRVMSNDLSRMRILIKEQIKYYSELK